MFLAIDPTNPADRGQLAGLPDALRGRDFSDPQVRAAFIAYAKYLALNYKPAYLALGVEVDMFFNRRGDAAFRTFQSLYFEAYDAVKSVSPDTLVFPTFQYEDMIGLLAGTLPAWSLIDRFDPKIDLVAVSTFPGFVLNSINDMSEGYYDALLAHLPRPAAFVSVGWSSQTGETDQFNYLTRVLKAADAAKARLFVWYLARDPVQGPDESFGPLAQMGLQNVNGTPKTAWSTWRRAFDRPLIALDRNAERRGTIARVTRALALLAPFVLLLWLAPAAAAPDATTINGADLAHAVRLARADEDALIRRLAPPPRLDSKPAITGSSYVITSSYWDDVLRHGREDLARGADDADYFPSSGYVRAHQGVDDVWLVPRRASARDPRSLHTPDALRIAVREARRLRGAARRRGSRTDRRAGRRHDARCGTDNRLLGRRARRSLSARPYAGDTAARPANGRRRVVGLDNIHPGGRPVSAAAMGRPDARPARQVR